MRLWVTLQPEDGLGEQFVMLDTCFKGGEATCFETEMNYFTELVALFADLCVGRNFTCSNEIRVRFPIGVLLQHLWNREISLPLRAAFTRLLQSLYVDAYPREELKKPALCRTLEHLDSSITNIRREVQRMHSLFGPQRPRESQRDKSSRRPSIMDTTNFLITERSPATEALELFIGPEEETLFQLKEDILTYFRANNEVEDINELHLCVLQLAHKMMRFGLFSTYCTFLDDHKCVLSSLHPDYFPASTDLSRLARAVRPLLGIHRESKVHSSKRRSQSIYNTVLAQVLKDPTMMADSIVRASVAARNLLHSYVFENEEDNQFELEVECEILEMFHYIVDCRQDCLVNNALEWFLHNKKKVNTDTTELLPPVMRCAWPKSTLITPAPTSTFRPISSVLVSDLDEVLDSNGELICDLLLFLVKSTDFKQQTLLIHLLYRCYSQQSEMLKTLGDIYVVSSPIDIRVFQWLKYSLPKFKQQAEQSEIWLKFWQQAGILRMQSEESLAYVTRTIQNLIDLLMGDSIVIEGEPRATGSKFVSEIRQTIMYYMDVQTLIINLIRDGMTTIEEVIRNRDVAATALTLLFSYCHTFLRYFVQENERNQTVVYQYMHLFKANLSIEVEQIPLISAIYRNNAVLCSQLTEESLQPFLQVIKDVGRKAKFLEVFAAVQVVKGHSLPKIQTLVLKLFLGPGRVDLLYLNPNSTTEFLMEPMAGKEDQPFHYHAALLSALAKCGWGNDQVYLNEAKLQKLISLETLFALLQKSEDMSNPEQHKWGIMRVPLLEYFFHVYLEAQKRTEELIGNPQFLAYVKTQTHQFYLIESITPSYLEFFSLMLQILLVYTRDYISHDEDELFQDEESISTLKAFALAFERNAKKFNGVPISEAIQSHMEEFIKVFSIPAESGWMNTLRTHFDPSPDDDIDMRHWTVFQQELNLSSTLQKSMSEEKLFYLRILMRSESLSPDLSFSAIMFKYITYLSLAPAYRPPIFVVKEVVEVLRGCINAVELQRHETEEAALRRIQDELASYNLCNEILGILCYHHFMIETFHQVLLLSIEMLKGGNDRVQSEFYLYFINVPTGELFFQRMHMLLSQEMELLNSNDTQKPSDMLKPMLRLLQLLCEGHNKDLQMYLHQQTHSRRSYDLVLICVALLGTLIKRLRACDFLQCSQCFDTLTEFIQGPCKENQEAIISGSFLDSASMLLSIDETGDVLKSYATIEAQFNAAEGGAAITGWMVAHLKFKCMITIHSLLEGHQDKLIITRLMRGLHLELLQVNILGFFKSFEEQYHPAFYDNGIFGHAEIGEVNPLLQSYAQNSNPKYYQLVAETPFMIFHLMKKFHDAADPDQRLRIQADIPLLNYKDGSFAMRLIGSFSKLGIGLWKEGAAKVKKVIHGTRVEPEAVAEEDRSRKDRIYKYLEEHTGNIEVVFNGNLCRVYFPLPPYSEVLSNEIKEAFHKHADRSSGKAKLMYLLDCASDVELQLRCEYTLQKFISKHWVLTFISKNVGLWKDLGFLLTLILNFLILFSYSTYGSERLGDASFLYNDKGNGIGLNHANTNALLIVLGTLQIICTAFVVLSFLSKTSPLLAMHGWNRVGNLELRPSPLQSFCHTSKKAFWAGIYVLSDGSVLYYVTCIILSVLGATTSWLLFAFHLTEVILRYPSLQQVVQAVIVPWRRTILTYALIMVFLYYFGIVGYAYFEEFFHKNSDSLLVTTISVYDLGFKSNGGIGGALPDWDGSIQLSRVLYDDLCNIIVMIIMLNIWGGITKDTFTSLREQHEDDESDRQNVCFICSLDKETIERATKRPFKKHCVFEHNEWSYVLFLGYLMAKEETEFTGVESFVWDQYQKKDIQWFPQKQAMEIQAHDTVDDEVAERRIRIGSRLKKVGSSLNNLRATTAIVTAPKNHRSAK